MEAPHDIPVTPIAGVPASRFEPARHLTRINGAEYLEVKWRLVWFREVFPNGSVETELVRLDERQAVFKCLVTARDDDGRPLGSATGYGSETPNDFRDFLEKAETKAIGRALAALGFGTQFANDHETGDGRPADSPVRRNGQGGQRTQQRPAQSTRPTPISAAADPDADLKRQATIARTEMFKAQRRHGWSDEALRHFAAELINAGRPDDDQLVVKPWPEWDPKWMIRLSEKVCAWQPVESSAS